MGLDIYFKRVNKIDFEFAKKKDTQDAYDELEIENVGYFRKVNCLLPFFGYEDNLSIHPIEKCQIEELVSIAKELLKEHHAINSSILSYKEILEVYKDDKKKTKEIQEKITALWANFAEIASKKLPTTSGFFFGYTEYKEWYVNDLTEIVNVFEEILNSTDFDIDQIFMYCWW